YCCQVSNCVKPLRKKSQKNSGSTAQTPVCEECQRPIRDRYLLRVQDGLWHERCVSCAECQQPLQNTCFLRGKKLYCKRDYEKLFLVHCRGCSGFISQADLVMRVGVAAVFHLRCFCCAVCACRLQTGERCVLVGERLLCARDYQLNSSTTYDSGRSEDEDDDEGHAQGAGDMDSAGGEGGRPKRPRTILTTQQRRAFKASFEVSSKPCRKVRETLAAETGLSVRVVQVWFQNQRAKMKKLARRQQQQEKQCSSPQEERRERRSARPGQQQQDRPSLEACGFKLDPFQQGLTPPQMPGDHMNPYGRTHSDPSCHHGDCLSSGETPVLTPIDLLFSMQDSYFSS
uniref:LIM homeobox transcription factor 1, alpha n=1 Tax=Electrophorus electricus TaxID=8005 RepID=A0AAY5EIA9_ELEEL